MFIKFTVVAGPSINMYEKEALKMIKAMGLSGTVPSAMSPEDILPALTMLESKLNINVAEAESPSQSGYRDDFVDAKTRAFPLIELLKYAIKENKSVMWDRD